MIRAMLSAALLAIALAGCADRPAGPVTYVQVPVEVAGKCVPAGLPGLPADVQTPQQLAALADGQTRYAKTAAAYLALYAWTLQAGPAVEACR